MSRAKNEHQISVEAYAALVEAQSRQRRDADAARNARYREAQTATFQIIMFIGGMAIITACVCGAAKANAFSIGAAGSLLWAGTGAPAFRAFGRAQGR